MERCFFIDQKRPCLAACAGDDRGISPQFRTLRSRVRTSEQRVRFRFRFVKVAGSNPGWVMLGIYPEIVAQFGRSSSRSLAVLAAVSNAKVAGSNPGWVMHVFASQQNLWSASRVELGQWSKNLWSASRVELGTSARQKFYFCLGLALPNENSIKLTLRITPTI